MKDKWMNINYENDELKPYEEPNQDFNDNSRVDIIIRDTNYKREQILDSLTSRKYDDIMAFYLLLGVRSNEVKISLIFSLPFRNFPFSRMIRILKLN
jgi:MAP/microtubule affinity-regulating kinase